MFIAKWMLTANEYRIIGAFDNYAMHQVLCNIFDHSGIKFDISIKENMATILMQSDVNVVNTPITGIFQCKEVDLSKFTAGNYRLMVKLNAVKQVSIEGKKNHKKIPVIGEENVRSWLLTRQSNWGIDINEVNVAPTVRTTSFKHKTNNKMFADWHAIDMICDVTDIDKFRSMISNGIGSSRSLGCSLIKVFKLSN